MRLDRTESMFPDRSGFKKPGCGLCAGGLLVAECRGRLLGFGSIEAIEPDSVLTPDQGHARRDRGLRFCRAVFERLGNLILA